MDRDCATGGDADAGRTYDYYHQALQYARGQIVGRGFLWDLHSNTAHDWRIEFGFVISRTRLYDPEDYAEETSFLRVSRRPMRDRLRRSCVISARGFGMPGIRPSPASRRGKPNRTIRFIRAASSTTDTAAQPSPIRSAPCRLRCTRAFTIHRDTKARVRGHVRHDHARLPRAVRHYVVSHKPSVTLFRDLRRAWRIVPGAAFAVVASIMVSVPRACAPRDRIDFLDASGLISQPCLVICISSLPPAC